MAIRILLGMLLIAPPALAHGISESGVLELAAPEDAKAAATIVPDSVPAPAREPARLVVNQLKVWNVGATLKICFLDGSAAGRQHVAKIASEWTKYANLKFDFGNQDSPRTCVADGTENIKISFHATAPYGGYWSYVGKDSNKYSPSMNLENLDVEPAMLAEQEIDRLVWHEFGHAIGLEHEHQSPEAHCDDQIDWTAALEYYSKCCGWSNQEVKDNLTTMVSSTRLKTTPYDPKSIMHYALPAAIFKDGRNSRCFTQTNYILSTTDKDAISNTYPASEQVRQKRDEKLLGQLDGELAAANVDPSTRAAIIDSAKSVYQITTHGACSPVLTNVGGNVTLTLDCK